MDGKMQPLPTNCVKWSARAGEWQRGTNDGRADREGTGSGVTVHRRLPTEPVSTGLDDRSGMVRCPELVEEHGFLTDPSDAVRRAGGGSFSYVFRLFAAPIRPSGSRR